MKRFSTVRDTQRGLENYMNKRRRRRDTEVTRRRRGRIKRGGPIYPVISSLSVLHSPEELERFTELSREEKGYGGDRGDLGEKREHQKGREQSSW